MIGQTISHYKILEKLGEGGMGEVFLAEDTKLKRKVALKFLPGELTRDEEAKKRFRHEARAAAALDHPNICSVFEIDETEEKQLYIAMAYYEGQTLKDKLSHRPLPIADTVNYAFQICEGLKKAHKNGIIHRDIKSANILVTRDNVIKILDFGLAKLRGQTKLTREGSTLGTVAYMSPEQMQGETIDQRSDIWSLGVVLYEMISGQLPFRGEYEQAILYSIMNEEAEPLTSLRTNVPIQLEETIKKMLSKDPDLRYQHVDELQVDLKRIDLKSDSQAKSRIRRISFWQKPFIWQVIAVIAVLLGVFAWRYSGNGPDVQVPVNSIQITTATGVENYPSWAPEGKRLAYHSNQNGNYDIWVTQVNGGQPQNLTGDHSGDDMFPAWSYDGDYIAFWSKRKGGGYFVMPATGGSPTKLSFRRKPFAGRSQWSADNTKLAAVVKDGRKNFFIEIIDFETGTTIKEVKVPNRDNIYDLSWSSNGRFFAYVDAPDRSWDASQICILEIESGKKHSVTDGLTNVWDPSWSKNSRGLNFVSNRRGSMDLWRLEVNSNGSIKGSPRRITAAIGMRSAAWSQNEDRLAFSKGKNIHNIWSVPIIPVHSTTDIEAEQITFFQASTSLLEISPDGEWLYFTSDIKGNFDLWKMGVKRGELIQLTRHPAPDWRPELSPDGRQLLFHSMRSGNRDIWMLPVEGGHPRQITDDPASDLWADWSPDGREIVFGSTRSGNFDIWKKSLEDHSIIQLTSDAADDIRPHYFPDGYIYFCSNRNNLTLIWRIPSTGGNPEQISRNSIYAYGTNKQTGTFYFCTMADGRTNVWELSINPYFERPLTKFRETHQTIMASNIAAAPGNKLLYFSRGMRTGDIYVMDFEEQ